MKSYDRFYPIVLGNGAPAWKLEMKGDFWLAVVDEIEHRRRLPLPSGLQKEELDG